MMWRILSVSYDQLLLRTRQMMLEAEGYEVYSCANMDESLRHSREYNFDLFILGHSIPSVDRQMLVDTFKRYCPAPIISLRTHPGDDVVADADYYLHPDPEPLLKLVAEIFEKKRHRGHTLLQQIARYALKTWHASRRYFR
jgi:CheY-like chemotaxis protein